MDPEALDHAQATRDGAVAHRPHDHVAGLGHQPDEVPERVVRTSRLRIALVGLHLDRVNEVGKFDRVLDEEHRDVVADEVPIALRRIELHREAAHVARGVDRPGPTGNGREAREHLGLLALPEHRRFRQIADVGGGFEHPVRTRSARVDNPLGNALMVEVEDLFAQLKVLEQAWSARARLEAVLIVTDRNTVIGGQPAALLVGFAAVAGRGGDLAGGRRLLDWGIGHAFAPSRT